MDDAGRDIVPNSCLGTGGKFWRFLKDLPAQGADFDGNFSVGGGHLTRMAFEFDPLHPVTTDAESTCLSEHQLGEIISLCFMAQDLECPARATFLHESRGQGSIEGSGRKKCIQSAGGMFRGEIIQIAADLEDLISTSDDGLYHIPEDHTEGIRSVRCVA